MDHSFKVTALTLGHSLSLWFSYFLLYFEVISWCVQFGFFTSSLCRYFHLFSRSPVFHLLISPFYLSPVLLFCSSSVCLFCRAFQSGVSWVLTVFTDLLWFVHDFIWVFLNVFSLMNLPYLLPPCLS